MLTRCRLATTIVSLVFSIVCLLSDFHGCNGSILSKGKITMCVKDSNADPYNVVHGKKCDKKLVVTTAVKPEQKPTDLLYVNVSTVNDEVDKDRARLYNPFIITIASSPMSLVYPYFYKGTVNNKPYETSKREYWCVDGGNVARESDYSCKVLHDKSTGEMIWDSQGFCCRCSYYEDYIMSSGGRYHRGSTSCGNVFNIPLISWIFKNHDRQSAHCMHYDDLWYNVYKIGLYKIWFQIFVKAYDLVEKEVDGRMSQKLVEGGEITLSNFRTSGHGVHGRILATITGMFQPDTQLTSLTERYLLIPNTDSKVKWDQHPQTRGGAKDYLIVPRTAVVLDDPLGSCDKIGVSFTAFRSQAAHDGQGPACIRPMGSCLNNQVKDFFEKDVKARRQGKTPEYFPERHGKVISAGAFKSSGGYALLYKVPKKSQSNILLLLEISADDIILIYNKATGIIVKAFATDFESLSQDGSLKVVVQNTGLVTANFFVTVKTCDLGILRAPEQQASINPQAIHIFAIELRTTVHVSNKFTCTVNLWDARRKFLDSANVSFETTKTCVCLQSCSCACTGTADTETCVLDDKTDNSKELKFENVKLKKKRLDVLERFFRSLNRSLDAMVDLFTKWSLRNLLQIWILFALLFGYFKARLGIQPGGAPIAYFGWWWDQPVGQETFVDSKGCKVVGVYNKDGELIDPSTGEVLKSEKLLLFVGNMFFFLLFLCILGVRAARLYKKFEKLGEPANSLSSVVESGTTVYRNFMEFSDAEKLLTNPGSKFSLAGKLQHANKLKYKFIVVHEIQIIEIVEEAVLLLTPAKAFKAETFNKYYTEKEALNEITLKPQYVCLNEEPLFDYYSDDEQPPAPEHSDSEHPSQPSYELSDSSLSEPAPSPPRQDYPACDASSLYDSPGYEKPLQ